jgi:transposase
MLAMSKKKFIRDLYFVNGKTITEIAHDTGYDRKTVRKVINIDDWNEPTLSGQNRTTPKLEPFKAIIDDWLLNDKRAKKKQRHTSKRVFERLSTDKVISKTFNCSYETVNIYVQKRKTEIFGEKLEGSIPLEHKAGEAQADFGAADYYENDALHEGHHFNISFPYSNKWFTQLFPGENIECLLEGLENIFRHIGGVPPEIWFDNASTMVVSIFKGGERKLTERFERLKEHYGFTAIYCNPESGREKGNG